MFDRIRSTLHAKHLIAAPLSLRLPPLLRPALAAAFLTAALWAQPTRAAEEDSAPAAETSNEAETKTGADTKQPADAVKPTDAQPTTGTQPATGSQPATGAEGAEGAKGGDVGGKQTAKAGGVPFALPGMELPASLKKAEEFELRGEDLSAQMEYIAALRESLLHVQNKEETTFNLAQAEFLAEKLLDLTARTGENADLQKELGVLLGNMQLPPLTAARLHWAQIQLHMRAGEADKARAIADQLAFLRHWALEEIAEAPAAPAAPATPVAPVVPVVPVAEAKPAGSAVPADAAKATGAADAQPAGAKGTTPAAGAANAAAATKGTAAHKSEAVPARFLTITTPDGLVPLDHYLPPLRLRNVRMTTVIEAEQACDAALRLGAGAPVRGLLNGREFFSAAESRTPGFDLTANGLQLQKGRNILTLEFHKTPEFPAGFYARLTMPDGAPLAGVRYPALTADALAATADSAAKAAEVAAPYAGATQELSALVKSDPANTRAAYYLGWLLCKRQTLGANAPASRQLLLQAARRSPKSGIFMVAFAGIDANAGRQLPDRDNNLSRMALLKALEADPKNVAALNMLAGYYFDNMEIPSEAQSLAGRALESNPGSPEAGMLLCRIYQKRDWGVRALQLATELVRRNPAMPELRLLKADLEMSYGTAAEALKSIAPARAADHTDANVFQKNLLILRRLGKDAQAVELLQKQLTLYPSDNLLLRELAAQLLSMNDAAKAADAAGRALTVNPYDGLAIKLQAEALQKQGKDALPALQRALAAAPSDASLRDYLAFRGISRTSPLTAIPDLGAFAQQYAEYHPAAGEDGVFLLNEQCDEIQTNGTKRRTVHFVVRLPDQRSAEKNRRIPVWYDGDTEDAQVTLARVLHADGQVSTAQTVPIPREGDRQVTLIVFPSLLPGDVVEIEYVINQSRPDFFGDYFGHIRAFGFYSPARLSRYVLIAPQDKAIYLHKTGGAPDPTVQTQDGRTTRVWQMENLPAIEPLPLMPPIREAAPTVQISTFQSWDALAKWYWNLIRDQNLVTGEIKEKLAELTAGDKSQTDKLTAIFNFVSNDIRNNAWEFGVHGYKPYNAGAIFTRRFGDCKDKATLINVMAREAGLEAWPVLLRATDPSELAAGRAPEDLTLPILGHFNHCIAMVVAGGKRYYLDGTIQYHTIDALPFTDAGAEAIIVRPEGAERVALPPHTPQMNAWDQELTLRIDEKGATDIEDDFRSSGQGAAYLRSWFRNPQTWDNVMRNVSAQRYGRVAAVVVEDVGEIADKPNTMGFQGRVRIADYAKPAPQGMTFRIPAPLIAGEFGKSGGVPEEFSAFARASARSLDVVLPTLFSMKRKIHIEWPEGWSLSDQLDNQEMKTPFGTLQVSYHLNGNLLEIEYDAAFTKQRIAAAEYKEFRRFCNAADRLSKFTFTLTKD